MKEIKFDFDYSKLRGKIREVCGTEAVLCKNIKRTPAYVSNVLNNKAIFTVPDIELICNTLGIDTSDIPLYFFVHRVA